MSPATAEQPTSPPHAGEAAAPAPAVQADGLGLALDGRTILRDVRLQLPAGQTVALLGANGAGKSTLLRVLATLLPPTGGRLMLFGRPVDAEAVAVRRRIGLIAHQPMLYRDLSARENLEFFGKLYGVGRASRRAAELLDLVALSPRADEPVKRLSRGMTQRVSIARALMHDPDLLLADEPFAGLDVTSSAALEALFGRLRQEGKTLIVANHDVAQSLRLADRAVLLRRGHVALDRPAAELDAEAIAREIAQP